MRSIFLVLLSLQVVYAFPSKRQDDGGVLIVPPPRSTDTGLKQVPDADHPFQAPGPDDLRGPCPGLNTMANHGFLPRNGIASFEQIVNASREAFNMEYTLASALAAVGMLARGNAFTDQVSIGLPSPLVPPLPGNIDGPVALGLATHGRFEGDVSMTRQDAAIGDNRNFQEDLFDVMLTAIDEFGSDDPITGPKSIVTTKVMQEFKFQRFTIDQAADPKLEYHVGRLLLSYGEAGFILNFFANGTTGLLSVPTLSTFFRNQTFPDNWHRRSSPGDFTIIGAAVNSILGAHPILPGTNDANGNYVVDADNDTSACALYSNMVQDNLPAVLTNTTGLLKQNVDTLLDAAFAPFSAGCPRVFPAGEAGI